MSLNNVDSSSGELIATGNDGDAVSTAIVQDVVDGDFSSVKNIHSKEVYANISEATVVDTLVTSSPIANGDNLVIVKDDDTIHEVVASGVTVELPASSVISSFKTSATSADGHIITHGPIFSTYYAWKPYLSNAPNGYLSAWISEPDTDSTHWYAYEFAENMVLNSMRYNGYANTAASSQCLSLAIYGWNGSVYVLIHTEVFSSWVNNEVKTFSIPNTTGYIKYKFVAVNDQESGNGASSFSELSGYPQSDLSYSMDTTAITAGEIPSKVFTVDSKVSFDDGTGFIYPSELGNNYLAIIGAVPAPDLTPGLVAHYLLNNNADDSFGSYDSTSSGGVDFQGDMASFDGVNDRIDTNYYVNTSAENTFSIWVHIIETSASDEHLFTSFDGSTNRVYISYGANTRYLRVALGNTVKDTTTAVPLNESTNIVVSSNGSTASIYMNGILIDTFTFTGLGLSAVPTPIGCRRFGSAFTFDGHYKGRISNLRIYNEAKDQTFIDELYEEGYYSKPLPKPTTDGFVAHYPLTGTAEDATGNYDGIENGGISYVDAPEFGSVVNLDGIDDYIVSPLYYDEKQTISLSTWFKTSATSLQTIVGDYAVQSFNFVLSVTVDGNIVVSNRYNLETSTITTSGTLYNDNKFHHVVCLIDTSSLQMSLYVDGVKYGASIPISANPYVSAYTINKFHIGTLYYSPNGTYLDKFKGAIKDTRFYNRVLLAQEITDIYNYEKNFRPIDIDDGLVAYYLLARNSLDNYGVPSEYDGVDTDVTYDGESAIFNGSTSEITVNSDIFDSLNEFSISAWCKLDTLTSDDAIINGWGTSTTGLLLYHDAPDGWRCIFRTTGNSLIDFTTNVVATPNIYEYITITYTITGLYKLYINGVLSATLQTSVGTIAPSPTGNTFVGGASGTRMMDGNIAHLRVYNKAITAEQVEVIYNTEKEEVPTISSLTNTRQYDDIVVNGRTIETKIELKSIGDKCTEVSADLWKNP